MVEFIKWLAYALALTGALVVGFNRARVSRAFLLVGIYLAFAFVTWIVGQLLIHLFSKNVLWYNAVIIINFVITLLLLVSMFKSRQNKRIVQIVFGITAVFIIYFLLQEGFNRFASRALSIKNLAISLVALLYFYEMLHFPEKRSIFAQGNFWVVAALMVYHVSTFAFWMIYELLEAVEKHRVFLTMNVISTLMLYAIMLTAVLVETKQLKNAQHT